MIFLFLAAGVWTPPPCPLKDPRACATRDLAAADRAMNAEYSAAMLRLRNCRPKNSTKCYNMPRASRLIEAEQKSWVAWRNAHCDVLAFGMEGTSAETQVREDCRTGLTVKRTQELAKVRKN